MKTKRKTTWFGLVAFGLFAIVSTVILRWLWSDAFISEFHSDMADTLFWTEAAREANSLASPTFRYNYFIPFGEGLFLHASLPLLGFGVTSMRCSMTLFLPIFAFAVYRMFRSFQWNRPVCWLVVACLFSIAASTPKMREIYFGHVLYYSLGTVFLFLSIALMPNLEETNPGDLSRRERILRSVPFFLCMTWAASCGSPLLLYAIVPAFAAWLLVRMGHSAPFSFDRDFSALLPGLAGTVFGMALFSFVSRHVVPADYGFTYSLFSATEQWWNHLEELPKQWIALLSPFNPEGVPVASLEGLLVLSLIAFVLFLALTPLVALVRICSFSPREKTLVVAHWILSAEILVFWICGNISDGNWRLAPVALSSAAVSVCFVRNLLKSGTPFPRKIAVLAMVFLIVSCVSMLVKTVTLPGNRLVWYGKGALIPLLERIGIPDGYCTEYWFSNATTTLSGGRFRIREVVRRKNGTWQLRPYLTDSKWYEPSPDKNKTVFVCHPEQEPFAPKDGLKARYECEQFDFWNGQTCRLVVLAYDGDCMNAESETGRRTDAVGIAERDSIDNVEKEMVVHGK